MFEREQNAGPKGGEDGEENEGGGEGEAKPVAGQDEHGEETEDWLFSEDLEGAGGEGAGVLRQAQDEREGKAPAIDVWAVLRTPEGQRAVSVLSQVREGQQKEREAREERDREMEDLVRQARGEGDEAVQAKLKLADKAIEEREGAKVGSQALEEAETQFWQDAWTTLLSREDLPQMSRDEWESLFTPAQNMTAGDYLWHVVETMATARIRQMGEAARAKREAKTSEQNQELAKRHAGPSGEGGRAGEPPGPASPASPGAVAPLAPGEKVDMNRLYDAVTEHLRSR